MTFASWRRMNLLQEPRQAIDGEGLRRVLHAIAEPPKGVYSPSDDSFLMLEAIASVDVEGKELLDVGTGSGILGLFCAMRGASVTLTDVDEASIQHAQKAADSLGLKLETRVSDLFSNVKGKFDLILFNPPYLPSEICEDRTVDGGPMGTTLARRFLQDIQDYLKEDGTAFLLVSTQNDPTSLIREYPRFQFSLAAKRSLFFEELQILSVRFRMDSAG